MNLTLVILMGLSQGAYVAGKFANGTWLKNEITALLYRAAQYGGR
jgi:hypothetical protein